jgi:hypothetical protein
MHEYDEIIDRLLEGIEQLYLIISVQQAFLTIHFGKEWEPHIARAQVDLAPHIAELFAPLRDALAGAPDGSYPAGDWRRVVQGLVDTANPPKPHS